MPYSAKAIANYFLYRANAAGQEITPMKMQKLVYIAHGWHLAIHGEPLIDEPVEAWRYGPVIPSLFQAFRKYGASPIAEHVDGVGRHALDNVNTQTLDDVMEAYGEMSAIDLMRLTHADDSPWSSVRDEDDFSSCGEIIDDGRIKDHFAQLDALVQEKRKQAA